MKTLRSLVGLLVIASALYVAWKVLPVYLANYQLEEAMDDNARDASVNYLRTEDEVRSRVLKQARELDIPLSSEQLKVQKVNTEVYVWGEYTVHVDLPYYPLDLHFQPASKNKKRTM